MLGQCSFGSQLNELYVTGTVTSQDGNTIYNINSEFPDTNAASGTYAALYSGALAAGKCKIFLQVVDVVGGGVTEWRASQSQSITLTKNGDSYKISWNNIDFGNANSGGTVKRKSTSTPFGCD
jgi:hypothetical protein